MYGGSIADGVMVDHLNNHIFKHKSIILEIPMVGYVHVLISQPVCKGSYRGKPGIP